MGTNPDPYEQLIGDLTTYRDALGQVSDALARKQDEIGDLRVAAQQKPKPPPGTPEEVLTAVGEALAQVQAARRTYEAEPHLACADVRYDTRGDCDGPMVEAPLLKPMNGLPIGHKVPLCRAHWWQGYGRQEFQYHSGVLAPPPDPEPEEVILREGVVVRPGDTLILSYPEGTADRKVLEDLHWLRQTMPAGANVTLVHGASVSVIRAPEEA